MAWHWMMMLIWVHARFTCRQHPWFTLHLPRYLAVMQADTLASAVMIDEDIVSEVGTAPRL